MRLWLDDTRPMPSEFDLHVISAHEAIKVLANRQVTHVSLDHDLGNEEFFGNGTMVANYIEEAAHAWMLDPESGIPPLTWAVHSANSVGGPRMELALEHASVYWAEGQQRRKYGKS